VQVGERVQSVEDSRRSQHEQMTVAARFAADIFQFCKSSQDSRMSAKSLHMCLHHLSQSHFCASKSENGRT
jgi:hypothetical protein